MLDSAEEGGDFILVGNEAVALAGHQLVQEGGSAIEQEREGTEEEVGVLSQRLMVALITIFRKTLEVVDAAGGVGHHAEESAVEGEVVTVVQEEVISGQRRVGFKLVVTVETGFLAGEGRVVGCAGSGVTSDGQLHGHWVTVGESETEQSEQVCKVEADIVQVLLSIDEFLESRHTVASQEVVVGSGVETGARTTDVGLWVWLDELVCGIALN